MYQLRRSCCPIWAILVAIAALAAVAVAAYVVYRKVCSCQPCCEDHWDEEDALLQEDGVRYTTDKDFE